ncbi:hypothetical protein BACI348_41995 [Bacillus altitudinis]|uniref:Uncharacterized protein n=1 Tax=Bacillus altitudinis TaxID=293387 RepID=A0A653UTP2_BACAB|nr:hypothetical protein BACI9J_20252 [Bacillus altitudinis]VXB97149.1 hypothetical protein BACI348_41995 [Bacillus altitudinis]
MLHSSFYFQSFLYYNEDWGRLKYELIGFVTSVLDLLPVR